MAGIDETREEFCSVLKNFLKSFPEGYPKNELWNDISRGQRQFTKKKLGVAKLSDALQFCPFLEEVSVNQKLCVRLKVTKKEKKGGKRLPSQGTQPAAEDKRKEMSSKNLGSASIGGHPAPPSAGLLAGELLGPALWQAPQRPQHPAQQVTGPPRTHDSAHLGAHPTPLMAVPVRLMSTPGMDAHSGLLGDWPTLQQGAMESPAAAKQRVQQQEFAADPGMTHRHRQALIFHNSNSSREASQGNVMGHQGQGRPSPRSHVSSPSPSPPIHVPSYQVTNPQPRVQGRLSKEQVDSYAQICIDQLSEAGEYVCTERIEALLLQRLQRKTIRDLQLQQVRSVDHLPSVREHQRTACKVNACIQAFIQVRSICTLHEIEQSLLDYAPVKQNFESFKLGPLQKLPIIYDLFKFPPEVVTIPKITTMDILQHIREFLTKENKWTEKLEMEPTMNYLVERYGVPDAYHLGVRIRSLPLAVQMLKKAQRDAGSSRKAVLDNLKEDLQRDLEGAVQRFRASVLQSVTLPNGESSMEIRKHYLETAPELVIVEIFSKFQLLMSLEVPENNRARKRHTKVLSAVADFLTTIRDDEIASKLFHLSVCVGVIELQEMVKDSFMTETGSADAVGDTSAPQQIKRPPPVAKIVEKLQSYLDRCLTHGTVTLQDLQKIEENLLRDFEFPSFHSMGLFSFLGFLLNYREAKMLLEQNCGVTLGSSGAHSNISFYQPRYTDVLQVVRQAEGCGLTELPQIEEAVCSQFCVKDVRILGYGMLDRLKKAASKSGKHHMRENLVVYESTLCTNSRQFTGSGQTHVGLLGHQTKESARLCLNNCPLMEDMEAWSNWSLVFEPELGTLKEFVQKYGGLKQFQLEGENKMAITDFVAMETRPGQLIKLISQTSVKEFEKAVQSGDPRESCGHLVSQIVANKGVAKTSVALLANHVKSALYAMNASSVDTETPGGPPQRTGVTNRAIEFVLRCLNTLPIRICCSVANQIFLTPLGEVLGSRHSKIQLLKAAEENTDYMSHLLKLGCFLGIREWTEQFHTKLRLPAQAVTLATEFNKEDQVEELAGEMEMEEDLEQSDLEDSSDESSSSESDPEEADKEEPSSTTNIGETDVSEERAKSTSVEEEDESGETTDASSSSDITYSETSDTDKCKELINQIRKEEFGIGVELSEDGQKLMKVQQERLGRSLDRLSKDLYSKDTHFVLELVQNADDNEYPVDTDQSKDFCPAVEFVVDATKVVVSNNESGFEERNIRAICDVGRSTKGKHKFGYIGQKGIGFKSVFRVTDCPEVHSNGFHIKFDVNSGPTGYILPHWMEESPEMDKWMTQIILPFKKEAQTRTLAARFNDIHPSLLLFLHRLRQLSVINKVENRIVSMKRRDLDNNVVEIEHNETTDLWLVVRKALDASQISLQAKSGVEVESTEIALAFPLKPPGQTSLSQMLPPKQEVFAFLPLHSYGFRFIIQGDFDVPSSREDVDKDSAWNQWLRTEIPTLFIEAYEAFKAHKDFTLMEAICSYLQMVPTEDEILGFFQPVATHILQKLRGKNCIPTHPNSKGEVYMKKPSQVITTRDSLVKEVVNPDMLHKHLNLFYLHGDLAAMLNPSLTLTLGIETVTTQHLLHVGKAIALGLQSGGDADYQTNVVLMARWMACVYRSMEELQDAEVFSSLKAMNIIPLSEGKFVSLDSTTVFFPVAETTTSAKKQKSSDPFMALQTDLFAVHPDFINTPDNVVNSQVKRLLQELGVKDLSPVEVIGHHIMPVLKSPAWEQKSKDLLICYVVYIKQEMEKNPNIVNWNELRDAVKIVTSHGIKNPFADAIHFPPQYGNKISLRDALPGYDWVFLDPVYLNFAHGASDLQSWREFFTKLGVVDFLSVKPRKIHLTAENIGSSPWSPLKETWPPLPDGYVVSDYCCEEFHKLLMENVQPESIVSQMKALATLLDQEWDRYYSQYQIASVSNTSGERLFDTESSFSIHLHATSWFPCLLIKPVVKDNAFVGLEENLMISQPFLLYNSVPEIKTLLSHTVPYMAVGLAGNSSFGKFLKVRASVDTKTVLGSLVSWAKREDHKEPAVFCTTIKHIKTVYQFLFDRLSAKEAQDLLHEHPVIFVPVEDNAGIEQIVAGHMVKRDDVWWEDPTGLFSKHKASLKEYHADISCKRTIRAIYADMEEFFTGRYGRIQLRPSMTEYAKLWIHIASTEILSRENHTHHDVLCLMAQIGNCLLQEDSGNATNKLLLEEEKKQLKNLISNEKIFPSKRNIWVSLSQHPMIPDDRQLELMFEENKVVHFLNLEEAVNTTDRRRRRGDHTDQRRSEAIKPLLLLCGVAPLSSSVDRMEVTELSQPCPVLMMYMHKVVPFLQQYLYNHFPDVYQRLITANMAARLLTMSFMQVGTLEVVYSLRHSPETIKRNKEACTYDQENNTFFFHKEHVNKYPDINREIAKCFSDNDAQCMKDLRGFLAELTSIFQTSGDVQELLDRHDLMSVPLEDAPWHVAKPEIQMAPQPVKEEVKESKPEKEGSASNDDELRAWPPRSSLVSKEATSTVKKGSTDRPTSKVWPPPKPPSYMETRELPPRFQNLPPMDGVENVDEAKSEKIEELHEKKRGDNAEVDPRERPGDGAVSQTRAGQRGGQQSRGSDEYPAEKSVQAQQDSESTGQTRAGVSNEARAENSEGKKQMESDSVPGSCKTQEGMMEAGEATAPGGSQDKEASPNRDGMGRKRFPPDEIATPSPKKPSLQLDAPVWNEQTMSEMSFEEIGTGSDLQLPEEMEIDAGAPEKEIGDWGERLVRNYLLQLQKTDRSIQYVIWSKETGNEGNPYDFEVIFQTPDGQKSIFIEVKTTLSSDKGTFEISAQELRFALDHKENFHLYRIYSAGSKEQIRLVRITNVPWQLDKKKLRLYMVI
ncbi:uncharacterized protein LOC135474759 [Liolophura sinensis]|uniref:uncharacterized protein LOC135474759 n=1 Tax=Liolophura sinensis TaxID=3198878 RepID=UPI003159721D